MTKLEQMNNIANEIYKTNKKIGSRIQYFIATNFIIGLQYYLFGISDLLYTTECNDKNLLDNLEKLNELI